MCITENKYYEIYNLDTNKYKNIDLNSISFSKRLKNRLLEANINTVDELLKQNDLTLSIIDGLGEKCISEIHTYFKELLKKEEIYSNIKPNLNELKSVLGKDLIYKIKDDYEACKYFKDIVQNIVETFEIKKVIDNLDYNLKSINIKDLILAFTQDPNKINHLITNCNFTDTYNIESYIKNNIDKFNLKNSLFNDFISWCKTNITKEIDNFLSNFLEDRSLEIVINRAKNKTLKELGDFYSLSRERIRQIEKYFINKFYNWQNYNRIIYKLFCEINDSGIVTSSQIIDYIGNNGHIIVYLIKNIEYIDIIYDEELEIFLWLKDNLKQNFKENIEIYINDMPNIIDELELNRHIKILKLEYSYPEKLIYLIINNIYSKSGKLYHKDKLSLISMYSKILEKYYSNGIYVYNDNVIREFKKFVDYEFNVDISHKNNRAIVSVLQRICILCGKGIYMLKTNKPLISKQLANKIYEYIKKSKESVFLINTLFYIFKEHLFNENIDNKYLFQGILKNLYSNEFFFKRDYISKDNTNATIYENIFNYIKNSKYPIKKIEIMELFPGITDVMISFVSNTYEGIISLFGEYVYIDNLNLSKNDIHYFKNIIEKYLKNKGICNCKVIYEYIMNNYRYILESKFINSQYALFNLLEFLFSEKYNFNRPFISYQNAKIGHIEDIIKEMICESNTIEISYIMSYAREQRYVIYSILSFINNYNNTHLFLNKKTIANIEYLGVNQKIAEEIESMILDEISSTIAVNNLYCVYSFPKVNVPWNEWLIYSILNKWSSKLDIGTTDSKLKNAYVIVAPKGCLDRNNVNIDDINKNGFEFIDIEENIDNIIMDILEEEFIIDEL